MTISDDLKNSITNYIMLNCYDDQFIDRQEEKKILEQCVANNISVEEGLALISQIAQEKHLVIEREAEQRITDVLAQFAANDGKVDKKEFHDAVNMFQTFVNGKISEPKIKRRLKEIMEDKGWQAKEGGLFGSKWFSEI
jgi:hypothetical protein